MYCKNKDKGLKTDYFTNIYKEHLRVWNGFKEYDNPSKNTFEDFINSFNELIGDIGSNGFDSDKSVIPVSSDGSILNGSHRIASCIHHSVEPSTVEGVDGKDGQWDCGYEMFRRLGLDSPIMDSMAIEYSKIKTNTRLVTLYPTANPSKDNDVINIMNKHGKVVYGKSIDFNLNGSFHLSRQLYLGEEWAGDWDSNFTGFRQKTQLCFKPHVLTRVFLVEFNSQEDAINCKKEIRQIFRIANHSVHINDYHHETIRLSRMLFNDNSVHYMNNLGLTKLPRFDSLLSEYSKLIPDGCEDDYCVTASGVLSAYGLKDCNDLDYLHFGDKVVTDNQLISSHNEYGVGRYSLGKDEIIYNPKYHFWYNGIKFASLDIVKELKEKRGEPKDVIDVSLINSL